MRTYVHIYIHAYICTYIYIYIHTYIPWIHKCVINTAGCGTFHKYIYTSLHSTILRNILRKCYKSSLQINNSSTEEKQCVCKYFLRLL